MTTIDTMQAWACAAYGGPENLTLETRAVPVPESHQVLIKVEATTVDSGDVRIRTQNLPRGMGLMGRLAFGFHLRSSLAWVSCLPQRK